MKKITYIAVAALALAACSKTEIVPDAPANGGTHDIEVSVNVGTGTKATFDGNKYVNFASGDKFYGAIAKKDTPTVGVMVADYASYEADDYYSSFTIENANAVEPTFKGHLYNIKDADYAEEYNFYGIFPYVASFRTYSDLTKWTVKIKQEQSKATQTSWDGDADAMIMKPTTISTVGASHNEKLGEYTSVYSGTTAEFSHLFGFGKIAFAGIPAQYADQNVKSVRIEAVGENKELSGVYKVDITKPVSEITPVAETATNYITITPKDKVKVSEFNAWFVANPGTFDVKITVSTLKADFIFERQGLVIERSKIAEPTVNFKATDVTESHDIALADGEKWEQVFTSSSQCISSSSPEKEWGPTGKTLVFSLDYPNSGNSNYGSSLGSYSDGYVQGLAYQNIQGGKVVLSSATAVTGASIIKANFGIYNNDVTADFNVSLVDGENVYSLGTVNVIGSNANVKGKNYFFNNTENKKGQIVITVDNFSDTNCRPYLGSLTLNPEPEIDLSETSVKVTKDAGTSSVGCSVYAATSDPTVSVSEDAASWLTASYDAGKVNFTVTENAGAKRSGKITLTVKGLSETTVVITVTQMSATAMEYTLTVTSADVHSAITTALAGAEPKDEFTTFTAKFKAKSKTTATTDVEVTFSNINYSTATDDSFQSKSNGKIFCTSSIGEISKIVVVSDKKIAGGNYNPLTVKFSDNGTSWTDSLEANRSVTGDSEPYTSTVINENEAYKWFNIFTGWQTLTLKSFEVTFVAE